MVSNAEPVCHRHSDRISYVRCQRCEEPACPECLVTAAVGMQCVDCVKVQDRKSRTARSLFGGRAVMGPPWVTWGIIVACIVVFLLQIATSRGSLQLATSRGSGIPLRLEEALGFVPALAQAEPWRFVTAGFLHSTQLTLHIAFNLLALYQIGPMLEVTFGRLRFAMLYLVATIGGSVGFYVLADPLDDTQWNAVVIGASGAVFGLFGALLWVQRRLQVGNNGLYVLLGVNFMVGLIWSGIAWQSHLGGLLTGVAVGAAIVLPKRERRSVKQAAGVLLVLVVLALGFFWRLA
jgi:membrane associated rhomboid family serine protease